MCFSNVIFAKHVELVGDFLSHNSFYMNMDSFINIMKIQGSLHDFTKYAFILGFRITKNKILMKKVLRANVFSLYIS